MNPPANASPSRWKRLKRSSANWLAINVFGRVLLPLLVHSWRRNMEISEELRVHAGEPDKMILAFWHNRQIGILAIIGMLEPIKVLVSRHGDGEIIARIVARFGIGSVRGSSTRGNVAALRRLVTETHSSHIAITPDGPIGPRYTLKDGIIGLAAITRRPIFWISFGVDRAWVFDSWDRFILPKPFAKLRFRSGGPIRVDKSMTEVELAAAFVELETEMRDQTALLDEEEGHAVDPLLRT